MLRVHPAGGQSILGQRAQHLQARQTRGARPPLRGADAGQPPRVTLLAPLCAQVVNRFTTRWVHEALHWAAPHDARSPIGERADAACTDAVAARHLGVLVGSRLAGHSIVCAPPASGRAAAACPCCWRASEAAGAATTGCVRWDTAM